MAFTKITENDTINKGVMGLPDTPNLSTSEMQAKFEELSNDVIIPKFNNLVDELGAKSAAGNIGATIPSGINAESENVQAVLNGIAEKAHTHEKSDAELTDAVTKAHEHSNKSVIDKFTENESGVPLYNGGKMTGDAFKTVKVGTTSIVATDYDTIEIIAGDNVVIDADEVNKTLKFSSVGGSGSGGGDMYKAVYDKNNDGMVDDAKTVGSLDLLNTTNKTNAVTAINEVLQDHTEFVDHGSLYSTNTETFKDLESGFYRLRNYKSDLFPGSVAVTGTMQKNVVGGHHTGTIITTDGVNYTRFADYDSSGTLVSDTGWKKMSVDTLTTMEQVEASTDLSKPVGAGAVKELNSSLAYWIANGYLPDPNNPIIYLYNNGDENTAITGGFANTGYTIDGITPTQLSKNTSSIELTNASSGSYICIGTQQPVNVSNYTKLKITIDVNSSAGYGLCVGMGSNKSISEVLKTINTSGTHEIDISTYSGNNYIAIWCGGSNYVKGTMTKVALE